MSRLERVLGICAPHPDPSGLAISREGRFFLGFPRHSDDHDKPCLAEVTWERDSPELVPFPDAEYVLPQPFRSPRRWLVSPHGMVFDKNDVLWVVDDGKRAGVPGVPEGAAKVVAFDIEQRAVLRTCVVPRSIVGDDAHLNDLRVDPTGRWAYVTNSGFGPHYSLVVVDLTTGACREFLKNHPRVSPEPGFMTFIEGTPRRLCAGDFPTGGADGIALGPHGRRLFWTVLSGRALCSIDTHALHDFGMDDDEVERRVVFHGQRPTCDGIAEGPDGSLFFGSYQERALVRRDADGEFTLIVQDSQMLGWPDCLLYRDGYLYVTLGQWDRAPEFHGGTDMRRPPFWVARVAVPPMGVSGSQPSQG